MKNDTSFFIKQALVCIETNACFIVKYMTIYADAAH